MNYEEMYNELLPKYEKLQEDTANKTQAIKEERDRRKAAEAKLASQETVSQDHVEALEKENQSLKSKLEKKDALIAEKDTQITQLTDEKTSLTTKATQFDEYQTKTLESAMAKIPDEKKEFVNKALAGKSVTEQLELAEWFAVEYGKPDYTINPKWTPNNAPQSSAYEQAKEKNDIRGMIKNAPVIEAPQPPTT